jgi:hypothetical protein
LSLALGMTVREVLERHTSKELAELRAYEMVYGSIGQSFEREALASIHEALQHIARILIAANSEEGAQLPEIIEYPRPGIPESEDDDDG